MRDRTRVRPRAIGWCAQACALLASSACGGSPKKNAPPNLVTPVVERPAQAIPPAGGTQVRVRLRLNCEAICRNIERACRQACRPTSWSPENYSIQSACQHDCDFNEFSCTHECAGD